LKLLLHSRFYPSVGGIETVASIVAHEWVKSGVDVTVVTNVARSPTGRETFPFPIHHRPNPWVFVHLLQTHDIFIHMNLSLRALWPLLIVRRPFIAVHHGFYVTNESGHRDWREKVKLRIAKHATENIAVSESIARTIGIDCKVIVNPFAADVFRENERHARNGDLVFLGRLVSSKGVDVLIQALALLNNSGLNPHLTIIGEGPERGALEELSRRLGLADQTSFTGTISTDNVARLLREQKVLVVPSIWNEGFGVVALEGIASGCVVIGSDSGGLPEAIGKCGLVVRTGDAEALAVAIERVFTETNLMTTLKSNAPEHLARHSPARVAESYLTVISQALYK
jgi:glycogen synthase